MRKCVPCSFAIGNEIEMSDSAIEVPASAVDKRGFARPPVVTDEESLVIPVKV